MTKDFAHLHVHTEFSILDGASKIDELVKKAADDGMSSLGITDHGNMFGVPSFYKACKKYGIKPIIGIELYQAKESVDERPSKKGKGTDDSGGSTESGDKMYYHATAIAETQEGYVNLMKLSSEAYLQGFYRKPRMDWQMLEEHSKGVILTSGCLGGLVNQRLMKDDFDGAMEIAARYQDILSKDNFFIEIQDHGIPEQHQTNPELIEISKKLKAPLVVTNDSHYTHQHQHEGHSALLCVQTGSYLSDPNRFKFHGDQHYFKSGEEMYSIFPDHPEAADNTLLIAERCNVEIDFESQHLPIFPIPKDYKDAESYLRFLVDKGARERWGDNYGKKIQDRLDFEFNTIKEMGFIDYFIIVWDLVRHAIEQDIAVGPGRGSAAGSAIAYALKITNLDPIKYDLLFERFLNPARVSMPDIDIDFDSRYREKMIDYTVEKYGQDYTAQIITFGRIKAKAALRDAARVLEHPYAFGDALSKSMPPAIAGRDVPLSACVEEHEDWKEGYVNAKSFRELTETKEEYQEIVDIALQLEGARRSTGIHAAAVVISDVPLTEAMPVMRQPDKKTESGWTPIHTQYDMKAVDSMGFLKMDFLGLKNLDIIRNTLGFIKENHGISLKEDDIPLDDAKTYEMLSEGHSAGIFQLESAGMKSLLKRLKPSTFQDVAALVALYRPGPMAADMHLKYADRKNGLEKVTNVHPDAAEIMSETYGLMIYQELMMRIAQKFAGYSLADADILRRVCGKKQREELKKERVKFIQGCLDNGYSQEIADEWFDIIEPFADYAFNKSHAYGYGLLAVQTAWLKCNYPVEYMASLLISANDVSKMSVILKECKRMNIKVDVPDFKRSGLTFSPLEDRILFGLGSVKDVGEKAAIALIEIREAIKEEGEDLESIDIFKIIENIPKGSSLNKKSLEALIKVGAFSIPRHSALNLLEEALDLKRSLDKTYAKTGMSKSLFDTEDLEMGYDKWSSYKTRLKENATDLEIQEWERTLLGIWVTSHPLDKVSEQIEGISSFNSTEMKEINASSEVILAGVLEGVDEKTTRKGDKMAILNFSDLDGSLEIVVFPRQYRAFNSLLNQGDIVVIQGTVQEREDDKNIIMNLCQTLEDYDGEFTESVSRSLAKKANIVEIHLDDSMATNPILEKIKEIINENAGGSEVNLLLKSGKVIPLGNQYKVDADEIILPINRLLGRDSVNHLAY